MKIAVVISHFDSPGGAERVVSLLAREWSARGHQVHVITFDPPDARHYFSVPREVVISRLDLRGTSTGILKGLVANAHRIRRLRSTLRTALPDVVVSFVDVTATLVQFAATGLGIPHLACERTSPETAGLSRQWTFLRNLAYRRAEAVAVQTERGAAYLSRILGRDVLVLPNPLDLPESHEAERQRSIVSLGRFTREKGTDLLIEAFALAADALPSWNLVLAGDGPERENLRRQAASLGLESRVRFPGRVMPGPLLGIAGIFVLPSRREGFPNVLIEAMAHSCAVVAADCLTGPGEIIEDQVNGLLVPPEDPAALASAIISLAENPERSRALGRSAASSIRKFDASAVAAQWTVLLERLVNDR